MPHNEYIRTYPKLNRLLARVEAMQLHLEDDEPSTAIWLTKWLDMPFDELDGRTPAYFLQSADYDLILVGLLVQLRSRTAWCHEDQAI